MLNKAQIIGHLGQDPELRYTPSELAVTRLSVATNEMRKTQDGEKQKDTEWHRVVLFERLAEIAAEHLKKGSLVYVEGRLKTRKWQDQSGVDRYTTEILANQMRMLGGRNQQSNGAGASAGQPQETPTHQGFDDAEPPDFDDDIPF